MIVKHLCPWCNEILEASADDLKESDNAKVYAELGRSVINNRLLHVIMNCKEVDKL